MASTKPKSKVVKPKGQFPDSLEQSVGKALQEIENNTAELKSELQHLHIISAKEVEVSGGKKGHSNLCPQKTPSKLP